MEMTRSAHKQARAVFVGSRSRARLVVQIGAWRAVVSGRPNRLDALMLKYRTLLFELSVSQCMRALQLGKCEDSCRVVRPVGMVPKE